MIGTLNRATRRKLERETLRKLPKIEDEDARREIIQLHAEAGADLCYSGEMVNGDAFVLRASPDGLRYGERGPDSFCQFEVYGPAGEHLYGYGGDGLDLLEEVSR